MLTRRSHTHSGNALFMILIAIVLIAALTYAITKSDGGSANMTRERAAIAAGQLASFGLDLKRATDNIVRSGKSESTISFASRELTGYGTPDTSPANEVFNIRGGGVAYMTPPENASDGSQWEFSGSTAAPGVGNNDTPDLMVVYPHLSEPVCRAFNKKAGYDENGAIPSDGGSCVYDTSKRFNGSFPTSGANTMDGTFRQPAMFACVQCSDGSYNAYYVMLER